jgi:hypothetical protein
LFDVPFLLTCVMVSAQASPTQLLCPACRQATAQRFLYSKNGCDILQCAECGLGRAQASVFDPGAYYTGDYFSGGMRMATRTIAAPSRCCGENSPIPSILSGNTAPAGASLMLAAPMASSYRKRGPTSTWPASRSRRKPRLLSETESARAHGHGRRVQSRATRNDGCHHAARCPRASAKPA